MKRRCSKWMIAVAMLYQVSGAGAQGHDAWSESLIRMLSPELRRMESRLDQIEREMSSLPVVKERPWGSRYGFRSGDLETENTPDWMQFDLGARRNVDMMALVPVNLEYRGKAGEGYGFPKRFRIEISDHADMRDAVVLVDQSKSDVTNPGRYPLVYEFPAKAGRYIRLTSLKHRLIDGAYFWSLEEWIVMQGNMNVAASRAENMSHSSSLNLFPQWAPMRILDGQSTLGMPVEVTSPSPSQGYMSEKLTMQKIPVPIPETAYK